MMTSSHTWEEIVSQPQTWRATLKAFAVNKAALQGFLESTRFARILVVGCGSTHYLAQTAAATLAHCTGIATRALPSSELWLFWDEVRSDATMLLTVSRSGMTTETLRALERFRRSAAGPVLAITCDPGSPLARQADFALIAPDAQERSVAQTRSFTSMLLLTQALAAVMAEKEATLARLLRLPDVLDDLVDRMGDLPQRIGEDLDIERLFFLGAGPLFGLASEAMLKTKEMSLSFSEAYHPLEFRHGPMSMVNKHTLVVGLLSDTGLAEELRVLEHMEELDAHTLALVENGADVSSWRPHYIIELSSELDEWERAPLYLPVVQRLAYHRAVAKGLDPDRPNNLTAVVSL